MKKFIIYATIILLCSIGQNAVAGEKATIDFVRGDVTIIRSDGAEVPAKVSNTVFADDKIVTKDDAEIELHLTTGAVVKVGPNERKQLKDLISAETVSDAWVNNIWDKVERLLNQTSKKKKGSPPIDPDSFQPTWKASKKTPKSGDIRGAIRTLDGITQSSADKEARLEAFYLVGECYNRLGEKKQARQAYQDVIDLSTKSDWAKKARQKLKKL